MVYITNFPASKEPGEALLAIGRPAAYVQPPPRKYKITLPRKKQQDLEAICPPLKIKLNRMDTTAERNPPPPRQIPYHSYNGFYPQLATSQYFDYSIPSQQTYAYN